MKPLLTYTAARIQQTLTVGFVICFQVVLFGQQVVINDNAHLTIKNGAKLYVGNSASNAIGTSGTGGNIVSEGEQNQIIWNIQNATGTYIIPFTTLPAARGGNGTKIPVRITITSAGDVSGNFALSTYETATDFNLPYPVDVTSMNQVNNTDGSLYTIDRFWIIDNASYTTKPTANLSFTYDESANEIGGANLVSESELLAQRWNSVLNSWESLQFGTVNTTTNTVSSISVTPADFWEVWTLQSVSVPLNINFIHFYQNNDNCQFELGWEFTDLATVDHFSIEKSDDGSNWELIEEINAFSENGKFNYTERNTINKLVYYRISMISVDGIYEELKTVAATNTCEINQAKCFPNPFDAKLMIETPEQVMFHLSSSIGVEILSQELAVGVTTFDLTNLPSGAYFAQFISPDGSVQIEKIVKQ